MRVTVRPAAVMPRCARPRLLRVVERGLSALASRGEFGCRGVADVANELESSRICEQILDPVSKLLVLGRLRASLG